MRSLFFSFALALITFSPGLAAANSPVVVELFASQGCAACLPADKLLAKLAKRDDVIALALHVDYWDYLGWKDSFASPAFSARQRGYARVAHRRTVYTPQVMVQGMGHAIGNQTADIERLITKYGRMKTNVSLDVRRTGEKLKVSLKTLGGAVGPQVIEVVRYEPKRVVSIMAGENAGRKITYSNIVTELSRLATWNGRDPATFNIKISGPEPVVILVQGVDYGPILAAYQLR